MSGSDILCAKTTYKPPQRIHWHPYYRQTAGQTEKQIDQFIALEITKQAKQTAGCVLMHQKFAFTTAAMAAALEDTPVSYEDLADIERQFDDAETEISECTRIYSLPSVLQLALRQSTFLSS